MNGNAGDGSLPIPTSIASVDAVDVDYDAVERLGPVGSGSNATVSEARVEGRRVALKEPSVDDDRVADRFVREAEVWSRVAGHDHVVGVVDWGTGDEAASTDRPWLALEFVDGGDLRNREHSSRGRALWVARCLIDAVAHAHERGIVHLDLTPDNVLFRSVEDGWDVPKVGDWGLARLLEDPATGDGLTPPYAAPEQFEGDAAPDERTDVYGLGALVYRLLTGEAPYSGAPSEIEAAVIGGDPPTPTAVDPGLPAAVDEVVGRAMATDPVDRYETAAALRADVDDLLAAVVEDDSTDDGVPTGTDAALARQGFERVTAEYFEDRAPAPPSEAWRAGLDLVDVSAGYAVEREVERDGERVPLAERLRERLLGGESVAVVGPPGAGKSTVCKQVACAWHDAAVGPVLYRESGQGRRFDAPATLRRWLNGTEGHALVVVEDAVRGEASPVFDAIAAVANDPSVSVLIDARRDEWEAADVHLDRERERARQRAVAVESVPPPDREEYGRFVAAVERSAGTDLDVSVAELVPEIRSESAGEERQPGELFLLLHRLLSHLELRETDEATATTLDEAVHATKLALERRGETFLDVGVAANLLNAAGVGVHPELLHAVAPDEETVVAEAIDALDGRVLFTDDADRTGPYRAVHEVWSAEFLANLLDAEGAAAAHERVGRVLSRLLALADDTDRRDDVAWALRGETTYLETVATAPREWADAVVEDVFELGTEWPKLAPLYGTTDASAIELPAACSDAVRARRFEWRGEMYLGVDDYDRAERAYDRLGDLAEAGRTGDADAELLRLRALLGIARIHWHRSEHDEAVETVEAGLELASEDGRETCRLLDIEAKARLSQDDYESARETAGRQRDLASTLDARTAELEALRNLGDVFEATGEYDRASEYLEAALSVARDVGLQSAEGACLEALGRIAVRRGNYERATDRFTRSLARFREVGNRSSESGALTALGVVAFRRGDLDRAEQYYRESLEIARDIGRPESVASSYNNLGVAADKQGEHERAREYYRQSLDIERETGNRRGEASSLTNIASSLVDEGEFERAREYYRESLEIKRDIGDRNGEAVTLGNLGAVAVSLGDYGRATEHLEASLDIAREVGVPHSEVRALLNLGKAAIRQGEYDRGSESLERGLALAEETGDPEQKAELLTFLGEAALLGHDAYDRALETATEAREIGRDLEMPKKQYESLHVLGEIARRSGDLESASEHLEAALEILDGRDDPFVHGQVRLELGRVRFAEGALDAARAEAERAAGAFDDLGAVHWRARARDLLARVDVASGDGDGAREGWRTALETFEAVGAPQDALATLEALVETCREAGDERRAREWSERARETLADAPAEIADRHREWVTDHAPDPDGT